MADEQIAQSSRIEKWVRVSIFFLFNHSRNRSRWTREVRCRPDSFAGWIIVQHGSGEVSIPNERKWQLGAGLEKPTAHRATGAPERERSWEFMAFRFARQRTENICILYANARRVFPSEKCGKKSLEFANEWKMRGEKLTNHWKFMQLHSVIGFLSSWARAGNAELEIRGECFVCLPLVWLLAAQPFPLDDLIVRERANECLINLQLSLFVVRWSLSSLEKGLSELKCSFNTNYWRRPIRLWVQLHTSHLPSSWMLQFTPRTQKIESLLISESWLL